jgi:TRAP-type mannitol/chloroaromatic compound transport system substrate-binding protein
MVMKVKNFGIVVFIMFFCLIFGTTIGPADVKAQEPIQLTAVVPIPVMIPFIAPIIEMYVPGLEKASNGRLVINIKGGPEVVPPENQADAVSKGIIDMAFQFGTDYRHLVPEAGAFALTPYLPWEEREKGVFDYWVQAHKKIGVQYIGKWGWGMGIFFHITKKEVRSLSDLKGLKMDNPMDFKGLPEAFGMVSVQVSGPDMFTAMERGIFDGYMWSDFGKFPGWEKATKYVVNNPFLGGVDFSIIINQKKYDQLPQDLKVLLEKFTAQYERDATEWYINQISAERKTYEEAGCQYITLSSAEAKYLAETANRVIWEKDFKTTVSSKVYNEVRALLTK